MNVTPFGSLLAGSTEVTSQPAAPKPASHPLTDSPKLREAFDDFVGQSFFHQLMKEMRKTVGKPAYFHGGRAEEIFQARLDQTLAEKVSDASAKSFTEPMYKLFLLGRAG